MTDIQPNLKLYRKMEKLPFGRFLFSQAVCFKAPYFRSIKPRILHLEPGHAQVKMRKRRAVQNHIGTVHAIAMCNLAEFAGGMMTDITIPTTHRWIPKGMTVAYLKKAATHVTAHASVEVPTPWPDSGELITHVDIKDTAGNIVAQMDISMWVTRRK
ncbi:hotdog fold domain-containing protein [Aliidiomarina sanyensis]|uniref:DUF4442 domain-containing protein n=1 Tax=Aliidiomarina sanyensis TaxID=1249555 RepID=A0A432WRN6_9GAMM|nr:hotdog fold domain-containing protein [Aliidiomarina sanyensis]RUO36434.1 DUF4442 domain-containing protein [Aliidiomarina sanyensis]